MNAEKNAELGRREHIKSGGFNFPVKTLLWTFFAIAGVSAMRFQTDWLQETVNLSPDVMNVITAVVGLLTILLWGFWWVFLSGTKLLTRLVVALLVCGAAYGATYVFRPVVGGDAQITRWEFVFAKREFVNADASGAVTVDLSKTSTKDYPEFLGAGRRATVNAVQLASWNNAPPKLMWRQSIGAGWSGFSAVNGFAVTMEQREAKECVSCYEIKTGELLWIHETDRRHEDMMGMGKAGPRSTPTVHEGDVYVQGATGVVERLDGRTGRSKWSVDLTQLLNIEQKVSTNRRGLNYTEERNRLAWGRSASPLIHKNLLIIPGGGPNEGPFTTLLALDKNSGEVVWKAGDVMISYGSPSLATVAGKEQVLLMAESQAMGFDPEDGTVLWTHERPGSSSANANCSQITPVSPNEVMFTKGYSAGGEVVKITGEAPAFDVESVWQNARVMKTKFNNPVVRYGYAYGLSDGYLECIETASGESMWKYPSRRNRGRRFEQGQYLLVGDKLLLQSERGTLYLINATPTEYEELGKIESVEGTCWNTLCLYDRYVLVRSELEMACFELPTENATSDTGSVIDGPSSEPVEK